METLVRALGPGDVETYRALRREGLQRDPMSFSSSLESDVTVDRTRLAGVLSSSGPSRVFGAFSPESPAPLMVGATGFLLGPHAKRKHSAAIWGVYVTATSRRQGLARRLMETALEYATTLPGLQQIDLSVSADSPHARALYESIGFRAWGVEPDALLVDGTLHDEIHMQLKLS